MWPVFRTECLPPPTRSPHTAALSSYEKKSPLPDQCLNTQLSEPVCLEGSQNTTILCVGWLGLLLGPPSLTSSVSCRKWRNAWRQNQQQLAEELAATMTRTLCRWKRSRHWGWFWLWITQMPVMAGSGDKWRHMADTYGRLRGLTRLHLVSVTTQFMAQDRRRQF